jgi:serine/threonine protein kinase
MKSGFVVNEKYEILGELGRGGMGIVYRARHTMLGRDVAIKVLNQAVTNESAMRAQREGQALANIKHPNLVEMYSLEKGENGQMMLVFDFVEGVPLSTLLAENRLDAADIPALFGQLCAGLQALHAAGFIHRDIKPSNLMISRTADGATPHLTIIDFGLVKATAGEAQKLTSTGAVLGTPLYMSPEQFSGGTVSEQSDNYSAACVLYEMITGRAPFNDESMYVVATMHISQPPPAIPDAIANHKSLDAFFATALAKAPGDRFRTAEQMYDEFRKAVSGLSSVSSTTSGIGTKRKSKSASLKDLLQGNRIKIIASAGGLAAILATAGYLTFVRHDDNPQKLLDRNATESRAQRTINAAQEIKDRGDMSAARNYLAREISELETNYPPGGPEMANLYIMYGYLLILGDDRFPAVDYDRALDANRKAVDLAKQHGTKYLQYQALSCLFKTQDMACLWMDSYSTFHKALALNHYKLSDMSSGDEAAAVHTMERLGKFDEMLRIYQKSILARLNQHGVYPCSIRRDVAQAYLWKNEPKKALELLSQTLYFEDVDINADADDAHIRQRNVPVGLAAAAMVDDDAAYKEYQRLGPKNPFAYLQWTYQVTVPAAAAVREATKHHKAAAEKIIDSIVAAQPQPPPRTEVVHFPQQILPEKQREYLFALFLCKEAAKRLGDTDREAHCANRIKQINYELVKHNCIFPGTFD